MTKRQRKIPMSNGPGKIGFVGCALSAASAESGHSIGSTPHNHGQRREVVVNGTRIKTVDVHAHCVVPEALDILGLPTGKAELVMTDTTTRIAAMDEQGIEVSALSINPYWYGAESDAAAELIKIQNDALVEICAATPDRFVAFATVALQHTDLAVEQVKNAVKTHGFRFRRGRGTRRSEISPLLGRLRGARPIGLHASAGHKGTRGKWEAFG
jgi:aminocarboxymuconate-semialdehyde decarboxylase